mgnify:FL=1
MLNITQSHTTRHLASELIYSEAIYILVMRDWKLTSGVDHVEITQTKEVLS